MELKRRRRYRKIFFGRLLIVPYGIETPVESVKAEEEKQLLIVPYGIETQNFLLPVLLPYTFNRTLWN